MWCWWCSRSRYHKAGVCIVVDPPTADRWRQGGTVAGLGHTRGYLGHHQPHLHSCHHHHQPLHVNCCSPKFSQKSAAWSNKCSWDKAKLFIVYDGGTCCDMEQLMSTVADEDVMMTLVSVMVQMTPVTQMVTTVVAGSRMADISPATMSHQVWYNG